MEIWCKTCEFANKHFELCFVDWMCLKYKDGCDTVLDTCEIALKLQNKTDTEN